MINPCDILAVDPGKTSGVAIFRGGELIECAEVDVASQDVERWVCAALLPAIEAGRTLVLVGETWGRGGFRGMSQWQGLGAAWKRWEWALDSEWKLQRANGHTQPAPKVLRVHTATWRSKVFGGRVGKAVAKQMAVSTARRLGAEIGDRDDNAGDAVCIGHWATRSEKVLSVIPKRFR